MYYYNFLYSSNLPFVDFSSLSFHHVIFDKFLIFSRRLYRTKENGFLLKYIRTSFEKSASEFSRQSPFLSAILSANLIAGRKGLWAGKGLPHRIYYRQWFFTPETTRPRRFSPRARERVGCSISQMKYYCALRHSKEEQERSLPGEKFRRAAEKL